MEEKRTRMLELFHEKVRSGWKQCKGYGKGTQAATGSEGGVGSVIQP